MLSPAMPSFFITGTDTGVGKTWFTCWLVRAWRARGHRRRRAQADRHRRPRGCRSAARSMRRRALTLDEINPIHFREPAAPLVAARAENRTIDFAALKRSASARLHARFSHLAVEGVGGWRVPLAPGYEVRDWARDLGLPVVVVARGTLGTLNHTLLTVESIRAAGLTCAGVVVNAGPRRPPSPDLDLARRTNVALLRDLLASAGF